MSEPITEPLRIAGHTCFSCADEERAEGEICPDCGSIADGVGGVYPLWFPWEGAPPCRRVVDRDGEHVSFEVDAEACDLYELRVAWWLDHYEDRVEVEWSNGTDCDTKQEFANAIRDEVIELFVSAGAEARAGNVAIGLDIERHRLVQAVSDVVRHGELQIKLTPRHPHFPGRESHVVERNRESEWITVFTPDVP